jgi:hypothetical protein
MQRVEEFVGDGGIAARERIPRRGVHAVEGIEDAKGFGHGLV